MSFVDLLLRPLGRRRSLVQLLGTTDLSALESLWAQAEASRQQGVGDTVLRRGLIDFSNQCQRGCTYCGIRAGNPSLTRYRMTQEEILQCAATAHELGLDTVVLQSGEDLTMEKEWLGEVVQAIRQRFPLTITLSVGQRAREDYALWRELGASRYLLKFETSDSLLYRRIHPPRGEHEAGRADCLRMLRELGYDIGSGTMVGLPGQTLESLADDLELMLALDLDMIAIGPYLPHPSTPLGRRRLEKRRSCGEGSGLWRWLTLKMLALARILCPRANIPVTSALSVLDSDSLQRGLRAGANVIMSNLTPLPYRQHYQLYPYWGGPSADMQS